MKHRKAIAESRQRLRRRLDEGKEGPKVTQDESMDQADELGMSRFLCPNCHKLDYADGEPECSRCGWTAHPPDEEEEELREGEAPPGPPKRSDLGEQLFQTACAINRVATIAARNDPGVMPVLKALECKTAKLSAPEFKPDTNRTECGEPK